MLWLCLLPHRLAFEALPLPQPADSAIAVAQKRGARRWIVASNRALAPGMDASHALALHPELRILERQPGAERDALKALAWLAYRFGQPVHLEMTEPGAPGERANGLPFHAVWVEAGASLRLFGGVEALLAQVRGALDGQALSCHVGIAPTLEGAALAAQRQAPPLLTRAQLWDWLGALPLAALRLPAGAREALAGSGLRRAAELLAIPLDMLARRFPAQLADYLDRLTGRAPDPRRAIQPPARFARRFELFGEVESTEALLFPLRRLLQEMTAYLRARDTGVQEFELRFEHADREPTTVAMKLVAPSRDAEHLMLLVRERLERVQLPAAVRDLELVAERFAEPDVPQLDLFDGARRRDAEWQQLLEKLIARLGSETVFGLGLFADHRPERAWKKVPPLAPAGGAALPGQTAPSILAERPAWLLDPPRPLATPPRQLDSRLAVAERVEGGWWDDADVSRDYYTVSLGTVSMGAHASGGAKLWVFCDRGSGKWFLQGLWA